MNDGAVRGEGGRNCCDGDNMCAPDLYILQNLICKWVGKRISRGFLRVKTFVTAVETRLRPVAGPRCIRRTG